TNVSLLESEISTQSITGNAANTAPNIDITARTVDLDNHAGIQADTACATPAGNISLNVGTLLVADSLITSISLPPFDFFSTVNAGSITMQGITGSGSPAPNVSLDNSTISTQTFAGSTANTAASIDITGQALTLANGADIRADTAGAAPAGN